MRLDQSCGQSHKGSINQVLIVKKIVRKITGKIALVQIGENDIQHKDAISCDLDEV